MIAIAEIQFVFAPQQKAHQDARTVDGSAQTAFVESITLHEDYNANTINNDVAILKLKTALTFNDNVKPACLPAATLTPSGVAVASGWGLIGQEPNVSTFDLMVSTFLHDFKLHIL